MTALRQRALTLLETMPEEQMEPLVQYMESIQTRGVQIFRINDFYDEAGGKSQRAYKNLEKYFGRITRPLDYKKELEEALLEKYESID